MAGPFFTSGGYYARSQSLGGAGSRPNASPHARALFLPGARYVFSLTEDPQQVPAEDLANVQR